jgi:DNA-binding transcriptional LysR family regulator
MDRIDTMRIFSAVATLGSFAEAARQMRVSPSVATRAMAQLEDQLGLMLLARTTRAVRLTERGQVYLESCRQILEDIESAERLVRGENAEPRGHLHVAAPIVFGRLHVLPVIDRVLAKHRLLRIRLSLSDRNVHLVEEGIDIALRIGDLADSSLIAVRVGTVRRVLVASPRYLAAHGTPSVPEALVDHAIVSFESIAAINEWRLGDPEKAVRVEPVLAVNTADAAIAAAEADIGITRVLSYQVEAALRAGRLVPVLSDFAPSPIPVSLVYPAKRLASANIAAFVATARAHFAANPVIG